MSGPKFRFALLVSFLVLAWWVYAVVSTYLLGERGLNFARYQEGIIVIGSAALAGFLMVWVATLIMRRAQARRTGFEPTATDAAGTHFLLDGQPFPVSFSKFLPELIAPPAWPGLTPLESEVFGFLNGYRHWPADLERADESLYLYALKHWDAVRQMPGSGPLHRIAALAQHLAKTHAYEEVRTPSPWWRLNTRDAVRFQRRSREHGGMSGFILSSMPGFNQLGETPEQQREQSQALLVALRYRDNPETMPTNAPPLAREIIDYLQRAATQLQTALTTPAAANAPDADAFESLKKTLSDNLLSLLEDLSFNPQPSADTHAILLPNGKVLARVPSLMQGLTRYLPGGLRNSLGLQDFSGGIRHAAWPHIRQALLDLGYLQTEWEGLSKADGLFQFQINGETLGSMVILTPEDEIRQRLLDARLHEVYSGMVILQVGTDQLKRQFVSRASALDGRLSELG